MKITNALLEKYAKGLCNPQEILEIEAWLVDSDTEVSFPDEKDNPKHKEIIWENISNNIFPAQEKQPRIIPYAIAVRLLVAACVIMICGLGLFLYQSRDNTLQSVNKPEEFKAFSTKFGQRANVTLEDGTIVHLNVGSELRIPLHFDDVQRLVTLKGEAFFEVTKDSLHPFVVNMPRASVQVLGTKFDVRAYPDDKEISVVVKEGKVQFSPIDKTYGKVILTSDEKGHFDTETGLREGNVYADRYLSWMDNKLVFDNQNIAHIAKTI